MSIPPPSGPYSKADDPSVCIGEAKPCGLCANCTMPQADPRFFDRTAEFPKPIDSESADDWWAARYIAAHRLDEAGRTASREMGRRANNIAATWTAQKINSVLSWPCAATRESLGWCVPHDSMWMRDDDACVLMRRASK